ncbi:Protein of unknown function [Thermomonospora echinospora]|uniref:DUF2510 domain-containing protein n=1 Tax=Thermomonospora echinospora TaxID=1992 RepID=A0A1H6B7Q1_9ACTN|nr:DUF2510 domain-containing protein [Thermomonospora echinospora]SEG56838.1 Protein of unknown function [Thermomonospora echinospora]
MSGQIPAGWYHDPYGTPGLLRYWDGGQWTQATQPSDEWNDAEPTQGGAAPADAPVPSGPPESSPAPSGPPASSGSPALSGPPVPAGFSPDAGAGQPGGSTPPPWMPPADGRPNWNWDGPPAGPATPQPWQASKGPQTPPPWQSPQGPGTPQPWQTGPPQPAGSNTGLLWALGGGGVVVIVLIVLVALFATGVLGGGPEPSSATAAPAPTATVPSVNPTGRSPVTGTITDDTAGVSYAQLGGGWQPQQIDPNSPFARERGFSRGQIAVVQNDYNGSGGQYLASVYSGRLPESVGYDGPEDLQTAISDFARSIETEPEPTGSYPSHTREDLESASRTIGDHKAHLVRFRLSFPQAASRGWNFRSETVAFVLIDQGSGQRPSVVWITVPDSHGNGGDLDLLLESIKVL